MKQEFIVWISFAWLIVVSIGGTIMFKKLVLSTPKKRDKNLNSYQYDREGESK